MKKKVFGAIILSTLLLIGCSSNEPDGNTIDNAKQDMDQVAPENVEDTNMLNKAKTQTTNLYNDLEAEFNKQVDMVDQQSWDTYKNNFNNQVNEIREMNNDNFINDTVDNTVELFNKYDEKVKNAGNTAIDTVDEGINTLKTKIQELINKF